MKEPTLAAKLRKLATDCRQCRHGYCCGQCLCCMPEEKLRAIVQEARKDAREIAGTEGSKKHVKHVVTRRFENGGYRGHCTCGWISDCYQQLHATGRAAAIHLRQANTAQVTP